MTRTFTKSSNSIQKSLLCAAFVIAGLMLAPTTAGAATRVNDIGLDWNKKKFLINCNQNHSPISCRAKGRECSCNDDSFIYIWRYDPGTQPFNRVIRRSLRSSAFVPGAISGGGGFSGGASSGGATGGRGGKP